LAARNSAERAARTPSSEEERIMVKRRIATVVGVSMLTISVTACGTLTGAAVGAGGGAAVGAATGYGAGKGALIGTGVGAAAGAIYDLTKK
jgi:osmotically inducible lipoprotein OsmB